MVTINGWLPKGWVSKGTTDTKLNVCGDWTPYKNEKCLKIITKLGTESEAKLECQAIDSAATLLTIGSDEEQIHMNNILYQYNNESDKAWLGVDIHKLVLNPWSRDTAYTNWAAGTADLVGYHSCVQMSLSRASLGKWSDEPCGRRALIVCQRRQEWTVQSLRDILESMIPRMNTSSECEDLLKHQSKAIDKLWEVIDEQRVLFKQYNQTIELLNKTLDKSTRSLGAQVDHIEYRVNSIQNNINNTGSHTPIVTKSTLPIGYIYIQLPNQNAPGGLWPGLNWRDITHEYQGLFFRVEGELSAPFGQIQPANYSRVTNVMASALIDVNYTKVQGRSYTIAEGGWTTNLVPAKALSDLYLYQSDGENRPINTAIKIWKHCA